jgi:hypothetical protein
MMGFVHEPLIVQFINSATKGNVVLLKTLMTIVHLTLSVDGQPPVSTTMPMRFKECAPSFSNLKMEML